MRPVRTAFGGRAATTTNVATVALIAVNALVFLLGAAGSTAAAAGSGISSLHLRFGLIGNAVAQGEYYRLFTAAFLHFGFLHIAFNMYALWLFGQELERLYGRVRFLALYFVSALGGSALAYLITDPRQLSAGASGAVFGLFGAYFVTARKIGLRTGGILALVAINLALGFIIPNIGWQAHIGGLVTGAAVAAVLAYAPRASRTVVQVAGTVVIVVLLCLVIALRTSQLTG
ncbi:MAG: rhomboid family intramembrane serine protease [Actinomycetota bacterium]|nr:rhomboid family intramembrane serine protease [Actinomycetota bacterium]